MNIIQELKKSISMSCSQAAKKFLLLGLATRSRLALKFARARRERVQNFEGVCISRNGVACMKHSPCANCHLARALSGCSRFTHPWLRPSPLSAAVKSVAPSFIICAAEPVNQRGSLRRKPKSATKPSAVFTSMKSSNPSQKLGFCAIGLSAQPD